MISEAPYEVRLEGPYSRNEPNLDSSFRFLQMAKQGKLDNSFDEMLHPEVAKNNFQAIINLALDFEEPKDLSKLAETSNEEIKGEFDMLNNLSTKALLATGQ
jgi:hypothetical protein